MKHRDLFKESLKNLKPVKPDPSLQDKLAQTWADTSAIGYEGSKEIKGDAWNRDSFFMKPVSRDNNDEITLNDLRLKAFKQTSAYLDKFQMPASAHGAQCKLEEKARQATENPEDFEQCPEPETEA